jgi:hypothetical protein
MVVDMHDTQHDGKAEDRKQPLALQKKESVVKALVRHDVGR